MYICIYMNIHSPKVETTQMSFNRWMVKKTVIHPYHGTLLSDKKEWTIDTHNSLNESQMNYAEWKKANPKRLYTIWFHLYNIFEMAKLQKWKTD